MAEPARVNYWPLVGLLLVSAKPGMLIVQCPDRRACQHRIAGSDLEYVHPLDPEAVRLLAVAKGQR